MFDFASAERTLGLIPVRKAIYLKVDNDPPSHKQKFKHKEGYNTKPKKKEKRVQRTCIGRGREGGCCGVQFTARGKFNRLCKRCTKWVADNG